MDKAHPLSSPMVVRSLNVKKDPFHSCENDEKLLGLKVTYFSVIGAFMYFVNHIHSNIFFSINLLVKYSSAQTQRQ